jgi:hypothetical protein
MGGLGILKSKINHRHSSMNGSEDWIEDWIED